MAYRIQADAFGDLDRQTAKMLDRLAVRRTEDRASGATKAVDASNPSTPSPSKTRGSESPLVLKPGALLTREWQGRIERVMALEDGFAWNGKTYAKSFRRGLRHHRREMERPSVLLRPERSRRSQPRQREGCRNRAAEGQARSDFVGRGGAMKPATLKTQRCAIYTRVSTDQGLEQEFNSLHAQREAAQAYIKSQAHEGWKLIRDHYDDGGFSGGSMERPALQKLLADIESAGSTSSSSTRSIA